MIKNRKNRTEVPEVVKKSVVQICVNRMNLSCPGEKSAVR